MNTAVRSLLFVAMLGVAVTAVADDAGTVIFAKGEVTAERQPPEALVKGDTVMTEDTVVTGDNSRAQLLMLDGAKIAIRPNSRLRIDEYSYTPPTPGASVTASSDKSVMSLVKGGFRTITGAIGKDDEQAYEVRTAVGVLGIRGTDYSAVFCNNDCTWVPGVSPAAPIANGLYLGVYDGIVAFRTPRETIVLRAGDYVFIPLDEPEPQRFDEPPPVLLDDNELRFDADNQKPVPPPAGSRPDDDDDTTGFNSALGTRRTPDSSAAGSAQSGSADPSAQPEDSEAPKQPTIATDPDGTTIDITPGSPPPPQGPRTLSYSAGPLGTFDLASNAVLDNQPGVFELDQDNNVVRFDSLVSGRAGGDVVTFDIGSASNVDTGFDSMTVLRWGRWSGGTMTSTLASSGQSEQVDLTGESLHWISGPAAAPPAMPITGVATYTLIGATSPTDNFGNVGVLGNATFQADFTTMIVDSSIDLDIAGANWLAVGSGTIGAQVGLPPHQFSGFYNNVIIDGVTGGSGTFSGFFSDPGPTSDPGFPGGVGLNYSLEDPQGFIIVSGAAAFGNP
ncbi:MAG: FecR family protein [Woeseiaceae bacterium]|nr:FecR family protein [Woeseiaceae bacterium]